MGIMCSVTKQNDVVTFDIDVGDNGRPVYRISWYNGTRWMSAEYTRFKDAHTTWELVSKMA